MAEDGITPPLCYRRRSPPCELLFRLFSHQEGRLPGATSLFYRSAYYAATGYYHADTGGVRFIVFFIFH